MSHNLVETQGALLLENQNKCHCCSQNTLIPVSKNVIFLVSFSLTVNWMPLGCKQNKTFKAVMLHFGKHQSAFHWKQQSTQNIRLVTRYTQRQQRCFRHNETIRKMSNPLNLWPLLFIFVDMGPSFTKWISCYIEKVFQLLI